MSLVKRIVGIFTGAGAQDDASITIDFAPIGGVQGDRRHKKALASARRRHGKPFVTERPVPRETQPSHLLSEISRKSSEAARGQRDAGSVTSIAARRKS